MVTLLALVCEHEVGGSPHGCRNRAPFLGGEDNAVVRRSWQSFEERLPHFGSKGRKMCQKSVNVANTFIFLRHKRQEYIFLAKTKCQGCSHGKHSLIAGSRS